MKRVRRYSTRVLRRAAQHWIVVAVMLWAAVALLAEAPAWAAPTAAPAYQTVPRPTPTRGSEPGATATPRGNDGDSGGDDNGGGDDGGSAGNEGGAVGGQPGGTAPEGSAPPQLVFRDNPVTTENTPSGVVTVGTLNVRGGPGASFAVVGGVQQNTVVTVLGRDGGGTWWLICCVAGATEGGWVSAQFIQPNFDRAQAGTVLPVVANDAATLIQFPTPTPTGVRAPVGARTPITTAATSLELEAQQNPPFIWPGKAFQQRFLIRNTGAVDAVNVEFSDEFPADVTVTSVEADEAALVAGESTAGSGNLILVQWPVLAAGQEVVVVANLMIPADVAQSVIDNLAAVGADNAAALTVAADIGLPPVLPPDFR